MIHRSAAPRPPWPPSRRDDPRFAAIADWIDRWPPGPLPGVAALDAALREQLAPAGLRLVPAPPVPRRRRQPFDPRSSYELRIAEAGEIPSRPDNLHDVFNALAWAAFPTAKWALTTRIAELQRARRSASGGLPGARCREHDRLALLDEGGLISLIGDDGERGVIVGHAIWEHAATGDRSVRAATVRLPAEPALCWAAATAAQIRAAVDAAWLRLVTAPERLHAAMAERAGVAILEAALWHPGLVIGG